jgi:hypothetical protein
MSTWAQLHSSTPGRRALSCFIRIVHKDKHVTFVQSATGVVYLRGQRLSSTRTDRVVWSCRTASIGTDGCPWIARSLRRCGSPGGNGTHGTDGSHRQHGSRRSHGCDWTHGLHGGDRCGRSYGIHGSVGRNCADGSHGSDGTDGRNWGARSPGCDGTHRCDRQCRSHLWIGLDGA